MGPRPVSDRPRLTAWRRTVSRFLVPKVVVSLWVYVRDRAVVSTSSNIQLTSLIRFGRSSVVKPYSIVQSSGGTIRFGRNCAISSFNHIAAGNADIIAGDYVRTGAHVSIIATTREYGSRDKLIIEQGYKDRGIEIGNDVLIGAGSVILDGCVIGDGAVIGVGSVVSGHVPPYSIVFGSPAKVIFWRK
jgi:acetyltransferase-like isoleucine patch superfamily enzyme